MSSNNYITLRQENERWGWSRHTVGMTFTSHATYSTRALAEDAARSIARCKDIPYLPTARGGFDRTPAKSPDPIDIAPPPPWLAVEEPAPAPPQSEQDALIDELTAAAIDAGHDRIIVLKAVDLVKGGHVFDLRFGGEWVVFSEQADMSRDDLWTWTPGIGSAPPAKRYLTSPQPDDGQLHCNCPNSWRRASSHAGKCKHWLASVLAYNLRRRLKDDTLFEVGSEGHWTHVQSGLHLGTAGKGELPESMTGYNPGLNGEIIAKAVPA